MMHQDVWIHRVSLDSTIGIEIFGVEEGEIAPPIPKAPIPMNYSDMECDNILPAHSSSQDVMSVEHGIHGSMSLSNILFVEREQQSHILAS